MFQLKTEQSNCEAILKTDQLSAVALNSPVGVNNSFLISLFKISPFLISL